MDILYEKTTGNLVRKLELNEIYDKAVYAIVKVAPSSKYKGIKIENGMLSEYDLPLKGELLKLHIQDKINGFEQKLDNDYRKNKYIDGEYSVESWMPIATERRAWRQELRDLQAQLQALENNG